MARIVVRALGAADRARWTALWAGYNAFYGRAALPAEISEQTWQRMLDPAEPVHGLVAEEGGEVVGLAHYLYHPSTISLGPSCYLQDLFTDERMRGRGVGRALIQAVYGEAARAGAARVYWQTHETNTAAQGLYDQVAERSGFIVYRKLL